MKRTERATGQIALPYVLAIGGVIIEVAIAGAAVVYLLSITVLGERLSVRANAAAYSGIQDGMRRISGNKEVGNISYCLTVLDDKAKVTVQRAPGYVYTIDSVSRVGTRLAQFTGTMAVDDITGKIYLRSFIEAPVSAVYDCP